MTDELISPHGGVLRVNQASEVEQVELQECALSLPQIPVSSRQLGRPGDAGRWSL